MRTFCEKIGFPQEATTYLCDLFDDLITKSGVYHNFQKASVIFSQEQPTNHEYNDYLQAISDEHNVNRDTVDMLFLLFLMPSVRIAYKQRNISDEIFYDSMSDITCKLIECKNCHGVWGTFVLPWYRGFAKGTLFKLGRLEYEKVAYKKEVAYKGIVQPGDIILNCHIPSCGPLHIDQVMDSLRQAYQFYGYKDLMPLQCNTWMLYPNHYDLFPEGGNLRKFYDLFDILSQEERDLSANMWRIFDMTTTDFSQLPTNTTLRRNLAKYLQDGGKMGAGFGMLLFDGEKIVRPE